ncbi:MAG: hypothetical protein ABJF01_20060 [bacterium]
MAVRWIGRALCATAAVAAVAGPFDIALLNTPKAPAAHGAARLVFAQSPFGIAVTADGHASYDVQVDVSGLPEPSTLGAYQAYVAWATTTDLTTWRRLGTVSNGKSTVGQIELNKFLFVITAEPSPTPTTHSGPTVLHGTSPSGWLQTFLSHPLFRGIPP